MKATERVMGMASCGGSKDTCPANSESRGAVGI